MPSAQQIRPAYSVPHIATYINDNSRVSTDTVISTNDPSVKMLCVFASPKGEDCTVKLISDTETYLKTFGTPNMALYGQAGYMPYLALSTGNAKCYCVRVTPFNALYANYVILAHVTTGENGTTVTYTASSIASLTDSSYSNIKTEVDALINTTTHVYPIMCIVSKGRGAYGNDFAFRITSDMFNDSATTGNGFKNYILEVLNTENGVNVEEYFRGSLESTDIVNRKTIYLEDVVNDPDTGSKNVSLYVCESGITALYNDYVTEYETVTESVADPDALVIKSQFDFIFGKSIGSSTTNIGYYSIGESITVGEDTVSAINFSNTTGNSLLNGSDGDFDPATNTQEEINTAITKEYTKAFYPDSDSRYMTAMVSNLGTGESTRRYVGLNSKRRTPVDIILDANYATSVKTMLVSLGQKRMDSQITLDCGLQNTISSLTTADETISKTGGVYTFGTYFFLNRVGQSYKTKDPFTGKVIRVTGTYALASMIPTHYINNGNHVPLVGERYAVLPSVIPGSVTPNIDADDLETKEMLYARKINTIDSLSDSQYIFATQITSQTAVSDLSESSNVAVLFELKRRLENLVLAKIYEFSEAEDRTRFTNDTDELFNSYRNYKVQNFSVRFDMNEFEAERNILHCYLEVIFRQISTRGIIEIDINKRVS